MLEDRLTSLEAVNVRGSIIILELDSEPTPEFELTTALSTILFVFQDGLVASSYQDVTDFQVGRVGNAFRLGQKSAFLARLVRVYVGWINADPSEKQSMWVISLKLEGSKVRFYLSGSEWFLSGRKGPKGFGL